MDSTEKSNTYSFAQSELDILCKTYPTDENPPIIKNFIPEILALVEKFGKSGQSGGSAPYTAFALSDTIKKLCLQQPICPITGIDDEWGPGDGSIRQNKRCYALFKENGRFHYLDAITWRNQSGSTWSGSATLPDGRELLSRAYIKGFPFKPKTFIVDIVETEVEKDNWIFHIKDESQLKDVFEYYDPFYKSDK